MSRTSLVDLPLEILLDIITYAQNSNVVLTCKALATATLVEPGNVAQWLRYMYKPDANCAKTRTEDLSNILRNFNLQVPEAYTGPSVSSVSSIQSMYPGIGVPDMDNEHERVGRERLLKEREKMKEREKRKEREREEKEIFDKLPCNSLQLNGYEKIVNCAPSISNVFGSRLQDMTLAITGTNVTVISVACTLIILDVTQCPNLKRVYVNCVCRENETDKVHKTCGYKEECWQGAGKGNDDKDNNDKDAKDRENKLAIWSAQIKRYRERTFAERKNEGKIKSKNESKDEIKSPPNLHPISYPKLSTLTPTLPPKSKLYTTATNTYELHAKDKDGNLTNYTAEASNKIRIKPCPIPNTYLLHYRSHHYKNHHNSHNAICLDCHERNNVVISSKDIMVKYIHQHDYEVANDTGHDTYDTGYDTGYNAGFSMSYQSYVARDDKERRKKAEAARLSHKGAIDTVVISKCDEDCNFIIPYSREILEIAREREEREESGLDHNDLNDPDTINKSNRKELYTLIKNLSRTSCKDDILKGIIFGVCATIVKEADIKEFSRKITHLYVHSPGYVSDDFSRFHSLTHLTLKSCRFNDPLVLSLPHLQQLYLSNTHAPAIDLSACYNLCVLYHEEPRELYMKQLYLPKNNKVTVISSKWWDYSSNMDRKRDRWDEAEEERKAEERKQMKKEWEEQHQRRNKHHMTGKSLSRQGHAADSYFPHAIDFFHPFHVPDFRLHYMGEK